MVAFDIADGLVGSSFCLRELPALQEIATGEVTGLAYFMTVFGIRCRVERTLASTVTISPAWGC